jgi:dihydrofolate reductase
VIGKNRELGCDNKLLWSLPKDMKRFKRLTFGNVVVMGRKTFESIGSALPGRENIVITRNENYKADKIELTNSIEKAVNLAKEKYKNKEIFIIGGASVYEKSLPFADKLYLTVINDSPKADTYFPEYENIFKDKIIKEKGIDNGFNYLFLEIKKTRRKTSLAD